MKIRLRKGREKMKFVAKKFEELSLVELYEILLARAEVFLLEQNIVCQDLDRVDYKSLHCFYTENDKVCAYLRAFYAENEKDTVYIGRVLTISHGKGDGRALMENALSEIKKRLPCKKLALHAQTYAKGFYEKFGFTAGGKEFLEEGVAHIFMTAEV